MHEHGLLIVLYGSHKVRVCLVHHEWTAFHPTGKSGACKRFNNREAGNLLRALCAVSRADVVHSFIRPSVCSFSFSKSKSDLSYLSRWYLLNLFPVGGQALVPLLRRDKTLLMGEVQLLMVTLWAFDLLCSGPTTSSRLWSPSLIFSSNEPILPTLFLCSWRLSYLLRMITERLSDLSSW